MSLLLVPDLSNSCNVSSCDFRDSLVLQKSRNVLEHQIVVKRIASFQTMVSNNRIYAGRSGKFEEK